MIGNQKVLTRRPLIMRAGGASGGGVLINDQFNDTRAAGAVDGTAATPGGTFRQVVDDANDSISVGGGSFVWEQTTGSNPWVYWSDSGGNSIPIARAAGVTARFRMKRITVGNLHCFISLKTTADEPSIADPNCDAQMRITGPGAAVFFTTSGNHTSALAHNFAAADTWDEYAIVLKSAGAMLYHWNGSSWDEIADWDEGTAATLYFSWMNHPTVSSDGKLDYVRVTSRPPAGIPMPNQVTIEFQTNKNGTFNPTVTMSSGTATWIIDGTEYNTNTPSVALAGDTVDVSLIVDPAKVTQFVAYNLAITSAPNLLSLTNLTYVRLAANVSAAFDASAYGNLSNLSNLDLNSTDAFGDVSGYNALTSLTNLNLGNTDVVANVGNYTSLTSLTSLNLYNVSGTYGDISQLTTTTALVSVYLNGGGTSYGNGGGAANWTSATTIRVDGQGWDQTEVSTFIGDIYAARDSWVAGAKTLNIGGSNAAPDATALTQISTLQASYSWTITYTAP